MMHSILGKLKHYGEEIPGLSGLITGASSKLQNRLKRWSKYLAGMILLIALPVLIGWQFNIEFFKRPVPGLVAMNPATAVSFIFLSISFFLLTSVGKSLNKNKFAQAFAILVLLIGMARIAGIFFGFDSPLDILLFSDKIKMDIPGDVSKHMAANTAVCLILSAISLLLLKVELRSKQVPSQWLAIIIGLTALLSILGYVYKVRAFYGLLTYLPMAIQSAFCFSFFSLAILCRHPDKGIMKELTGPFAGSITARLMIPAAIIVPSLLGLIPLSGESRGIYSPEFGTAALVLGIIIIFLCFIWYNTSILNKRDLQNLEGQIALQQSEQQIQTIFQYAPDPVIVIDLRGFVVKWNPKAESLFGWTSGEAIGRLLSELIIPERFRESHIKGLKHFAATGEGALLNRRIEIKVLHRDGFEFDVSLSISPTLVRNEYLFIGFLRDITARKKVEAEIRQLNAELERRVEEKASEIINSERRFRALIENSADIITMVNESAEVIYLSPAVERITGLTLRDFEGKTEFDFIHPDDVEEAAVFFRRLMLEPGVPKYKQHRLLHKNGYYLWTEGTVTNLLNDSSVRAVVSNFRNITERKNAEIERSKMTAELIQHVKYLEQFAYIVSHNLRAPVANLLGICDVLEDQTLEEDERRTYMSGLTVSVNKLDNVILDLNSILTTVHEINERKETVIFSQLLNDITSSISNFIKKEQVEIKSDFAEVNELITLKSYLHSIFYNLIMNGIKYRRLDVAPVMEIKSQHINGHLELSFKDNGMGIDLSKNGKEIFGLYKRFHPNVEGKGMGLFMVRTQVETLGGKINVLSKVNQGTEFKIIFPR